MRGKAEGFADYSVYTTEQLLDAYAKGESEIRRVIAGLSDSDLEARPRGPKSWSIKEIVLHLLDSEIQGVYRIRKAWAEPGATLPTYEEDLWTAKFNHQQATRAEMEQALALFGLLRQDTMKVFQRAGEKDWTERYAQHPKYGRLTLGNLLEIYADHSERHIAQILTIREKLSKPMRRQPLLPQRLY